MSDEVLASRLRERGQRVTAQRVVLYRVLRELGRHATAEEVLSAAPAPGGEGRRAAGEPLPQLSLPTVYATLDLLGELGLVRRIAAHAGAVMYDPRPEEHEHAVCRSCGSVSDLEGGMDPAPALAAARAAGFTPDGLDVAVYGLCGRCYSSRWTVSGENAGRQTAT